MRGIVIYFSFDGKVEKFAKKVADKCCYLALPISLKKSAGNLTGKFDAEFEDFEVNYDDYDIIIFGFSDELNSFMPALKKFYGKYPLRKKSIATFSINSKGERENFLRQVVFFFKKNKIVKAQRIRLEGLGEQSITHLANIFCRGLY